MPVQNNAYNTYVPRPTTAPSTSGWGGNTGWGGGNYAANDGRIYVNGRAGADAFPLPYGMNMAVLWDTDSHRFFIKGYDNNGIPRVLEDNDYAPHIEPEAVQPMTMDLSGYATKEDIQNMINEAFSSMPAPKMAGYVTKKDFDKALSELSVGAGYVTQKDFDKALSELSVGAGGKVVRG